LFIDFLSKWLGNSGMSKMLNMWIKYTIII
jgi:hypothetical protein